ncbi:hypothetical protein LTR37_015059 [Vermiconidia calcicola]|uniref:Uncharacterized protein n=1 Tax=Vermiconidia calcicola TaxID=1690605 RepID=A0ACC3MRX8_9PEZI|nr:hypothetical protein LTR37_015059 [Vermiconidia calcicola]
MASQQRSSSRRKQRLVKEKERPPTNQQAAHPHAHHRHLGKAKKQSYLPQHISPTIKQSHSHGLNVCASQTADTMASTETETLTYQDTLNSQYLTNSLSNLSSSRSTNSLIVRTYKQATQQYLTKQFKEALETLEPIITPPHQQQDGAANGDSTNGAAAPIAQSSRTTRTKIWVFYLSLLNAIIDLGPEEGKLTFGSTLWRQIAAKVRDGSIWEEVVTRGYGGNEGDVDADVVVNLATLLLGHMPEQSLNQAKLEAWLSASGDSGDGTSTPSSHSSSPKQLAARLKILELYTLHLLPANGEWEYAAQFMEMSEMLDEERKEAFLAALQQLREEKDGTAQREQELKEQREKEMEEERVEKERQAAAAKSEEEERQKDAEKQAKATPQPPPPNGTTSTPKPPTASHKPSSSTSSQQPNGRPSSKPPQKKAASPSAPPPPTFYRRASSLLTNFQQTVLASITGQSSMAMLRLLMFMVAFLLIVARRDLRMKVKRAVEGGWIKVKRTVGMGVKD